jgi:mannose-6-phosphate isomerase-like protein (cupin superfamily)
MAHIGNLLQLARDNTSFRSVVATGGKTQVVVMSIDPGSEIGEEVHPDNDQVLLLVSGQGRVVLEGEESPFNEGEAVLVPAGTRHNFITEGDQAMKIITTYSPPHHPEGTVHATKADAEAAEAAEQH